MAEADREYGFDRILLLGGAEARDRVAAELSRRLERKLAGSEALPMTATLAEVLDAVEERHAQVERAEELADFFHRSPNRRDYLARAIEPEAELADWEARRAEKRALITQLEAELAADERIVFANDDVVVLCPYWSGAPYEMLVIPRVHEPHLQDATPESLAAVGIDLDAAVPLAADFGVVAGQGKQFTVAAGL